MTDKLVQAQQRVRELAAKVEGLAAAVAKRPTEKKVEALAQARAKLARAEDTVAHLAGRAAIRERKRLTIEKRNEGFMRRIDKLAAAAPAVSKQWAEDRAKEPKRLAKMKAELRKRVNRDITSRPDWMQRPVSLPPPIEQPTDLDVIEPPAPPPREGLIPGTYTFRDPARLRPLLDLPPLPTTWTAEHVGRRLIDAHATLRCMPERDKPKGYGACWPAYRAEAGELAIQAGAGTLLLGRNRVRRVPSGDEVALMDEALTWIGQYLSGANAWARMALIRWADDTDSEPDDADAPIDLLDFIAKALNAEKRVVR